MGLCKAWGNVGPQRVSRDHAFMSSLCVYTPSSKTAMEDWFNLVELAALLELALGLESKWNLFARFVGF